MIGAARNIICDISVSVCVVWQRVWSVACLREDPDALRRFGIREKSDNSLFGDLPRHHDDDAFPTVFTKYTMTPEREGAG